MISQRSLVSFRLFIVISTCLLYASTAMGWGSTGHMLAARIAYEQLTPVAKKQAIEILKALPNFEELQKGMPKDFPDPDLFIFMKAATWPDMIRSEKSSMHSEHRSKWHYVDYPVNDGVDGPQPIDGWDGTSDPANILQALAKCEKELNSPSIVPEARAVRLCWILHLIGDLHQPLHTTSLFSKEFPTGDRGGNLFIVGNNNAVVALHAYWDYIFGITQNPNTITKMMNGILDDPKLSRDALKKKLAKKNYIDWARESFQIAKTFTYQNAQLPGVSVELLRALPETPVPPLPLSYGSKAMTISHERIVLAGYRLADKLNVLLKAK